MSGVCELFVKIAERCGEVYGCPIPQKMLHLGDPEQGWGLKFNPTNSPLDGVPPFTAIPSYNGWPAGVVDLAGGMLVAQGVEGVAEASFRFWLATARIHCA
jgi:hypothetical protein